jgi:hypothetical protein
MAEELAQKSKRWETWRIAAEWISGIFVLLHVVVGVHDFWTEDRGRLWDLLRLNSILKSVHDHAVDVSLLAIAIVIWVVAKFPSVRFRMWRLFFRKKRFLPSEAPLLFRGLQPYHVGDHLPGRRSEGERCSLQLMEQPFMVLEGESGCGKSSLLNAILLPKALGLYRGVRVRLADDPYGNTGRALEPFDNSKKISIGDAEGMAAALAELGSRRVSLEPGAASQTEKPLLLCIDQFEELFSMNDRIRVAYMEVLREALLAGQVRLLIVIRLDFSDLLINLCREIDSEGKVFKVENFYVLKPFRKVQALGVLHEIFAPLVNENEEIEAHLEPFEEALVSELLQPPRDKRLCQEDEKTVLPAELQMVGQMIESLGVDHFTSKSFRGHGGRNGLLNSYVQQAKVYVSRMGVQGDKGLLILRQLIPRERTRRAFSAQAIAITLGIPVAQVKRSLDAFTDLRLVNRVPRGTDGDGEEDGEMRYELMHEHLAQVLNDAADPTLQAARETEERIRFWRARMIPVEGSAKNFEGRLKVYLKNAFAQPIPLVEALLLLRRANRNDRRTLFRSLRGFGLRAAVVAAPVIVVLWGVRSDVYQVHAAMSEASSISLNPAAIMTGSSATYGTEPAAEFTASVVDNWTQMLLSFGYGKQARDQVERAIEDLSPKLGSTLAADFAGVVLDIEDANVLSAAGERSEATNQLQNAQTLLERICDPGHQSTGACFVATMRLANARGKLAQTEDERLVAVNQWTSALQSFIDAPLPLVQAGQFVLAVRTIEQIRGLTPSERELLLDKAITGVEKHYYPPFNFEALAEIGYEFYRAGDTNRAHDIWKTIEESVQKIQPFPRATVPPTRPLTKATLTKFDSQPSRWGDLLIETSDDPASDRAVILFYLGSAIYRARDKQGALEWWRSALGEAQRAEFVSPPRTATVPPVGAVDKTIVRLPVVEFIGNSLFSMRHFSPEFAKDPTLTEISVEAAKDVIEVAKERTGPCWECPGALAFAAGVFWGVDRSASDAAWNEALRAASELRDPPSPGNPSRPALAEAVVEPGVGSLELQQMESALAGTSDEKIRSLTFQGVSWMLLQRNEIQQALQSARGIRDERQREQFFEDAGDVLIDRRDAKDAKLLVEKLNEEAKRTGDDSMRLQWLEPAVDFEAQLGLYDQARETCEARREGSVVSQMGCLTTLIEDYRARKDERMRAYFRERDDRENLDWYNPPHW